MTSERHLPDWIDAWMAFTKNTEAPKMFRYWTAISVIASALQRKCRVDWGTSLIYYPNMYIVLVGPSGCRKGTAMNPGLDMLLDLGKIKMAAQATTLQALIRRLKDTNYQDLDLETGDMHFHSSMSIFSKEFTVFLGYHNRELMSALCDWYDCDKKWTYETIARKVEEVVGVWVNLFGATTPDLIRTSLPLDAIGGGLTSRIIYIYEPKMGDMVFLPMQTNEEIQLQQHLLHDLDKISCMSGKFKYTEQFLEDWTDFRIYDEKNPPFIDHRFAGYLSRRPNHVMKLSIILAASKGDDMTLTSDTIAEAITTLSKAEEKMQNVFSGVGRSDISDILDKVMTFLLSSKTDEVPVYQIANYFKND
ncbi:unnamed protein product, partial [marine sediment metagenome]